MTKIFFITQGCSLNNADTEVMKGLLAKAGFEFAANEEEADLIIFNTCTVKGPSESFFRTKLAKLEELNKPIIVAGCIAQTSPELGQEHSLIGVDQINNIVEIVEETLNGNIVSLIVPEKLNRLNMPKVKDNKLIEIIPISQGCLGEPCTYCKVKQARGHLYSYPRDDILRQAERAIRHGVKEIWLTAQDTGCYGYDFRDTENLSEGNHYLLPQLVKDVAQIPGEFMVRIGMANPNHVKDYVDELIDVLKLKKVFKFIHLPVQSGNDEVLRNMKRKYTEEEFKEIVSKLRDAIPELTLSTDIICGFPGETYEQFRDSVALIEDVKVDVLNVSKFWPRLGTEAAKMEDQIDGAEIKKRVAILTNAFDYVAFARNKTWRNWEGAIIIDEKGKDDTVVGRNFAYKPVILENKEGILKIGDVVKARIVHSTIHDLRAKKI